MTLHKLKILIILLTAFFSFENSFSIETKNLVSEIILTDKDTTFRINYLYDDKQNIVLESKAFMQYSSWKNLRQTEYYFSTDTIRKQLDRIWYDNSWKDNHCIEYIKHDDELIESSSRYNKGQKTEYKQIVSIFKDNLLIQKKELLKVNQVWVTQFSFDYKYENNQLKTSNYKFFVAYSLGSNFRNTNTYNADGTLNSVLEEVGSNDQNFSPVRQSTWHYQSATQLLSSQRSKIWRSSISAWENESMTTYDYNDNKQIISEIFYYWRTAFWEKSANFNYRYNSQAELITKEQNEPIYNEWRNMTTINYKPLDNENSQLIESTMGFWGGRKGDLVSSYIPYSFNDEIVINKAKQIKVIRTIYNSLKNVEDSWNFVDKFISIYPNPSDGIFYYNTADYKIDSWSILTANGVKIKQHQTVVESGVIDLTDIPRGVYFFIGNTAEKVFVQKLIKK